jgi:hypothetical protein
MGNKHWGQPSFSLGEDLQWAKNNSFKSIEANEWFLQKQYWTCRKILCEK